MNKRSSPGLGQWVLVTAMVVGVILLLIKLYQYGTFRSYLPAGLNVAGINVGGLSSEAAGELISNRYIAAPVVVFHGQEAIEVNPLQVEFALDLETMLSDADYQRQQQDFWSGFWGYLWGRPVAVDMVELRATHSVAALKEVLEIIASQTDRPAQPPQPVPGTLSFQYGESGVVTNIEASMDDVQAAFYRPTLREAHLVIEPQEAVRPDINLLARLIVNHLQDFEGTASVFIMDLASGEEVAINGDIPMSGMSIVKVPIVLETFRVLENPPNLDQTRLISESLVVQSDNLSANLLLDVVAGEDNAFLGSDIVTESMQRLGLVNTFIAVPYDEQSRPGKATVQTPANSLDTVPTAPDPAMQTTAEDIGSLLSMLYYCANNSGGALLAAYGDQLTAAECQQLVEFMQLNDIGSLIEEGVPGETVVAHKHGWIGDTHGDAGIIFSPGGDYVLVEYLHKPEWLEWEISSPLMAEISRATYNYFNFDNPFLDGTRAN